MLNVLLGSINENLLTLFSSLQYMDVKGSFMKKEKGGYDNKAELK